MKNLSLYLLLLIIIFIPSFLKVNLAIVPSQYTSSSSEIDIELLLKVLNGHRQQGIDCHNEYHPPAKPLVWNEQLASVAKVFVNSVFENSFGTENLNIGDFNIRNELQKAGYDYINIHRSAAMRTGGYSEQSFILWGLQNQSRCRQIMMPDFKEIGVAKKKDYWVMILANPYVPHYWNKDSINNELILELVNIHRSIGAFCGDEYFHPVDPVEWNKKLADAARIHSEDMSKNKFFSHDGSDGSKINSRVELVGYEYSLVAENLAYGETQNERKVVAGWMNSPSHCVNIMNETLSEMGVARHGRYWTQVLGHPRSSSNEE